ncbi:MAG: endonuclease/exonuclease/phosphatase family protein [Planctomycetaceae bacterium]
MTDERFPSRPAAEPDPAVPAAAAEVSPARTRPRPPLRGFAKWGVHLLWLLPVVGVGLFLLNGLVLARGNRPHYALTMAPALVEETPWQSRTIKVLTWDLGQCGARPPGLQFASKSAIRDRLIAISEVINREQPDLVVLLDGLTEFTLCDLNQPRSIAEATGMHCWAYGENFQVGLPFLRVAGGHAILSRRPLQVIGNFDLPGAEPFWSADPAHRSLWCQLEIDGRLVRLGAVRLSEKSAAQRLAQARWLVEATQGEPSLLAGNFEAEPDEPALQPLTASNLWSAPRSEPATFPAREPLRRLDQVLAPAGWELLRDEVLDTNLVRHRPVVSEFRLPDPPTQP